MPLGRRLLAVLSCLGVVLLFTTAVALAQERPEPLTITQVIVAEDGRSIQAIVSLVDAEGRPIRTSTDFSAQVDGEETKLPGVQSVVDQSAGLSVLLLFDVSGSMEGEPIEQAKAAASSFVDGLQPNDVAGIAAFSDTVVPIAGLTGDRAALHSSIDGLSAQGGTALYEAIAGGISLVDALPEGRKAIVLLSDGEDNGSRIDRASVLDQAEAAQLPVFAIGVGDEADTAFLLELARRSGGRSYLAPAPGDIAAIFDVLGEQLRSQYVLTLPLTTAESANRTLLVTTTLDGEVQKDTFKFLAPQAATGTVGGDDGGGVPPYVWLLIPAAAGAILLPLAGRGFFKRPRRQRRGAVAGGPAGEALLQRPQAGSAAGAADELAARLTVTAGPNAGLSVGVDTAPLEVGSGPSCGLLLDGADGATAPVHVRVWMRGDRLMVHHLARGAETRLAGKPIDWASLGPGEAFVIGPHTITFSLDAP